MGFWDTPQGAARLKLGILGRYATQFTSKVGSRSAGKRVCYFDGYAGQGFYDDGEAGSPAVVAQAVDIFTNVDRQLDGFLVEKDKATFEQLQAAAEQWDNWQVRRGTAAEYLDEMLKWAGSSPLLAFIDPFGLGIGYDDLLRLMKRSGKTELILNVSKHGVRRNAGHLTGRDHRAKETFIANANACLGGDWWQSIWTASPDDSGARDICLEFCRRIGNDLGCAWFSVPISDRLDGPIDYYLLFLTMHEDGMWHFNEAVSNTLEKEMKAHCEEGGQLYFDETEAMVDEIEANLLKILENPEPALPLNRSLDAVYGEALGRARQTHVRKALVRLEKAGHISETPKSKALPKFRPKRPKA